jgi:hypothetical protein
MDKTWGELNSLMSGLHGWPLRTLTQNCGTDHMREWTLLISEY